MDWKKFLVEQLWKFVLALLGALGVGYAAYTYGQKSETVPRKQKEVNIICYAGEKPYANLKVNADRVKHSPSGLVVNDDKGRNVLLFQGNCVAQYLYGDEPKQLPAQAPKKVDKKNVKTKEKLKK